MDKGAKVYDPDDVGLHGSPKLQPMKVNIVPSPSPPPAAPLVQNGRNRKNDEVLISAMLNEKRSNRARKVGKQALGLDSEDEDEDDSVKSTEAVVLKDPVENLYALATNAMTKATGGQAARSASPSEQEVPIKKSKTPESNSLTTDSWRDPMEVEYTMPSITATYIDEPCKQASPDTIVKIEIKTSGDELPMVLPPIRLQSPQSDLSKTTAIALPSISDQFGDQLKNLSQSAAAANSSLAQSPSEQANPALTPPRSENGTPSTNTEKPSTDQSIPAMLKDRTNIDGITNSQSSDSLCLYPGCNAKPFKTNVRSHFVILYNF